MTMNCGRWKSITERCQGISDGQNRMTAAILNLQRDLGLRKGAMMERLTYVTEDGEILFHPDDLPDDEGMTITQLAEERRFDALEVIAERLANREQAEEQGLLPRLPCKVGDTVYVDSAILPIADMECYEDINEIPAYFPARIVSLRFAKRNWMKIAVKTKWLHEWIDNETGPDSDYVECEKNFTILLSMIGKTVFLSEAEAEAKLAEMEKNHEV